MKAKSENCTFCSDTKKRLTTFDNGLKLCFNCGHSNAKELKREMKLKRILNEVKTKEH